jgi:mono/diheme cytochrome c family protein
MRTIAITGIMILMLIISFFIPSGRSAPADSGKSLYQNHCAICHGNSGKGDGPAASALSNEPSNFTTATFWQKDAAKKIQSAVEKGFGSMPPVNLPEDQIKDITDYMIRTFKK